MIASSENKNKLPAIAIIVLAVLLVLLVLALIKSCMSITPEILVLIALVTAISLSCVFDRFSIGKLIEMERTANHFRDANRELEQDKQALYSTLANLTIGISNVQAQSIVNKNIQYGHPKVVDLSDEQSRAADDEDELSQQSAGNNLRLLNEIRNAALARQYPDYGKSITRRVAIEGQDNQPDPISSKGVVFDARIEQDNEQFVYVVRSETSTAAKLFDRIYVKLARVYYYRAANRNLAKMILLIAADNGAVDDAESLKNKLISLFEPAISSGLLRIVVTDVSSVD